MQWVEQELAGAELGDTRLDLRLMTIVERLASHAEKSVPTVWSNAAQAKAAYAFWENGRVEWNEILRPHQERTVKRAMEVPEALVIQDSTVMDLTTHHATKNLGYLYSKQSRGLLAHTCLCVSEGGVPLGVLNQNLWTRPLKDLGKRRKAKRKKTSQKESQRWLDGLEVIQEQLADHPHLTVMGDREADFYDLFAAPRKKNIDLLVRVCRTTRSIDHPLKYLNKALEATPVAGKLSVTVTRGRDRKARVAEVTVRFATFNIYPPSLRHHRGELISLNFVLVEEINPPPNEKPIRWVLATTMPVTNLEQACRVVSLYTKRWIIERYHFTLKSGYGIEKQQLEDLENIKRYLATMAIVAWRVLWIMYESRQHPNQPCTVILDEQETTVLKAWAHKNCPKLSLSSPPTIAEAVKVIGQMGGHLGRKADGPPGVKTIWRGLTYLAGLTDGYRLRLHPPDSNEDSR